MFQHSHETEMQALLRPNLGFAAGDVERRHAGGIVGAGLTDKMAAAGAPFVFSTTEAAKDYLLREGTDLNYGARHLRRAVDRNMVHPLSNLMATEQVRGGDLLRVDCDASGSHLIFMKEAEDVAISAMLQMVDGSITPPPVMAAANAAVEPKMAAHAKSSRR